MRATRRHLTNISLFTGNHMDKDFLQHARQAFNPYVPWSVFETFWPYLNPAGGLMIFHNVPAAQNGWKDIETIRERVKDVEVMILQEPHKLYQNGCAIVRKTTAYRPTFERKTEPSIRLDLQKFMQPRAPQKR